MATNIWGEEVLDSKDISDEESVLYNNNVNGKNEILNPQNKGGNTQQLNGFYDKEGNFLGTDNIADNEVYVTTEYNIEYMTDEKGVTDWKKVKTQSEKLEISHLDFMYCAGVISQEGSGDTVDEMSGIGHVIKNNSLGAANMAASVKKISTVTYKESLLPNNKTKKANYSRAGLINALFEDDITDGAIYWDGEDFLAWGKNRPAKAGGGAHPKLNYGAEIIKDIYDNYSNAILTAHPTGKIRYPKYGVTCDVPNEVFEDPVNWHNDNTVFRYKTGGGSPTIKASFTSGRTIFWKKI